MVAYIIAAGEGSRLQSEGNNTKKPLIQINGKPMIERLLEVLDSLNFTEFNIITNEVNTEVVELLVSLKYLRDYNLNIIKKSTISSMHSFYELLNKTNNFPFFLFTVDSIFSTDEFSQYIKYCYLNQNKYSAIMAVTSYIDDEKPLYVTTNNDEITAFLDTNDGNCSLISSGMYYFNCDIFNLLQEQIESGNTKLRNFQRSLIKNNFKVGFFEFSKTIDVDHIQDIQKAEQLLKEV